MVNLDYKLFKFVCRRHQTVDFYKNNSDKKVPNNKYLVLKGIRIPEALVNSIVY